VRQFVITFAVTMVIVFAGGLASNAEAATMGGVGGLSSLANGYSPVQTVRCVCGPRGCACGRHRGRVWRCWWHRGRRVCGWRW
jgi:hypothetical protein